MYTERVGCRCQADAARCRDGEKKAVRVGDGCVYPSLAIATIPSQRWQNIYCAAEGLNRGTVFGELDLPWTVPAFAAGKCKNGGTSPCAKRCN